MNDENLSTFASDILAVDDTSGNLKLLLNLLIPAGYKVRPASNGAEALEAVKRKRPDLILLDIRMPGMDGFEVCKRLKADDQLEKIPVIFISALDETADRVKAFRAGGVDYITKPFQEEEVLMRVRTHLELHRMRMNLEDVVAERTVDLRMSEERFRMTFEQAAVGVAHVAPDGRILRINQKFCDIVEYSREEMLTLTFQDITHPDDLDADLAYLQQVLAGEIKTYSMEKRYFKKDGKVVWINLTVSLLREDNGDPCCFISVVEDIGERKEAEDLLGKSQAIAHIGNWSITRGRDEVSLSDEVCCIYGLPAGSTCTFEMFTEIIHPDDREHVKNSWMAAINQGSFDFSYRILVDGRLKWVTVKAEVVFHNEDGTISSVGTVQDITERKRAEQTIEEQLAFERLVSELSLKFVGLQSDGIDQAITEGLGRVAEFVGADRAAIVQPGDASGDYGYSHYWAREGVERAVQEAAAAEPYPWLAKQILAEESTVSISRLDDLPAEAKADRESFESMGVKSLLCLPLRANGVAVGAVSFTTVQSACDWPESVVKRMPLVASLFSQALERKKSRQALEERLRFQKLISTISTTFTGLSGAQFESAIDHALVEIGRCFNVDAVRLYRLSLRGEMLKLRINWRAEGIAVPSEISQLLKKNFKGFADHYAQGESIFFDSSHECPPWPGMRETMEFLGVKAGLGVPLETDDSGVDVFAMDKAQSGYTWPEDILQRAEAVGRILLGAVRRREAEVSLRVSYDEIRDLKERLEVENVYLRDEIRLEHRYGEIIGESEALQQALLKVEQVAVTDSTVLIEGETGTGKELLAQAVHDQSDRKQRTLVNVNCAALPSTLIESELFGREKGAYTGALTKQVGRFEIADRSSIFLDEIGELSLEVQAKLLRVLQEGQFERLGSSTTVKVDVRIIAATNRNLQKAVAEGAFREDLYYRLRVFPITIPPLRDRQEDIPQLVWHFVRQFCDKMGKRVEHISKQTMDSLQRYGWPGNVRELRNVVEHAMIISTGRQLMVELPAPIGGVAFSNQTLEEIERKHITAILKRARWRVRGKDGAAEILGIKPTTLEFRMKKLGIVRPR